MPVIGKRLKEARIRAGLSQEKLGLEAGLDEMSASTRMNRYELGKRTPAPELVERLATVLNVPAAYFYAPEDDIAELLVLFHQLAKPEREKILAIVRSI